MSFLRLYNIQIKPEYKQVILSETNDMEQYIINHNNSFENIDNEAIDTYIDLDKQALEAHRINGLIK